MDNEVNKRNIVVTGFDIFRDYKVNPSWEAVKVLEWKSDKFNVVKLKVPVTYDAAKSTVREIWQRYNPVLVIHVGVSHLATCLTLEECAVLNKDRYISPDVTNVCLSSAIKAENPPQYLRTGLDIDRIVERINELHKLGKLPSSACRSTKAGEYLCEYIYRCSLKKGNAHTLFIHVPQNSSTMTPEISARGIEAVIDSIVEFHLSS